MSYTVLILEVNAIITSGPLPRSLKNLAVNRSMTGVEKPSPIAPMKPETIRTTSTLSACMKIVKNGDFLVRHLRLSFPSICGLLLSILSCLISPLSLRGKESMEGGRGVKSWLGPPLERLYLYSCVVFS